jgi:hypothetical protein
MKTETISVNLTLDGRGEFKSLGGSSHDTWNRWLADTVLAAMPFDASKDRESFLRCATAIAASTVDMKPRDPVEAVLIGQMLVANQAALSMYQRAWAQPSEYFQARTKYLALADKAARTVVLLSERLDHHQGRGQQHITVKHVTVNAEQAVVADHVTAGSGLRSSDVLPAPAAQPVVVEELRQRDTVPARGGS